MLLAAGRAIADPPASRAVQETWGQLGVIDMPANDAGIGMSTVNVRFIEEPQPFWKVSATGFGDVV
jgi:gluconate 5-dehydrogenase